MDRGDGFKGRQFTAEVILWAVRWYLMFPISYRDLELMLLDRGVEVDHTTIFRWIQAYAEELEKRIRPHLRMSNGSWRWAAVGRRSTSCWLHGAIRLRRSGSSARRSRSRTPSIRARSRSTRTPPIQGRSRR